MTERTVGLRRALEVFLLFWLMQAAVLVLCGTAAALLSGVQSAAALPDAAQAWTDAHTVPLMMAADTLTVAALLLWNHLRGGMPAADYTALRAPIGLPAALTCGVLGASAAFALGLAVQRFPWPEGWMTQYAANSAPLSGSDPLTLAAVLVCAPCCEELVFRGRMYDGFTRAMPPWAAVIAQAALFGCVHEGAVWMIYAALMGLLFGGLRRVSGSLRPSLIAHAAFNAAGLSFGRAAARWDGTHGALPLTVSALLLAGSMGTLFLMLRRNKE